MITKKNLMILGGAVLAYVVWKKYIKEDEAVVIPLEGETSSNAEGDVLHPERCDKIVSDGAGGCVCWIRGKVEGSTPCPRAKKFSRDSTFGF